MKKTKTNCKHKNKTYQPVEYDTVDVGIGSITRIFMPESLFCDDCGEELELTEIKE